MKPPQPKPGRSYRAVLGTVAFAIACVVVWALFFLAVWGFD